MKEIELTADRRALTAFLTKATTGPPSKRYTDYTFAGAKAAGFAQQLRQSRLGTASELQQLDIQANPLGHYFVRAESALGQLGRSLMTPDAHFGVLLNLTELYNEGLRLHKRTPDDQLGALLGHIAAIVESANGLGRKWWEFWR